MYYLLLAFVLLLPPQTKLQETTLAPFLKNCHLDNTKEQRVLHLKGTAYEIGYQHGYLLKTEIAENIARFVDPLLSSNRVQPPVIKHFTEALPQIIPHIPAELVEEMQGISIASQQPYEKILLLNLFPEMFHCTGITVAGAATTNGELYHVRVLDYSAGNGLQQTAVMTVVEPEIGHPFLNITYAGFVGCVTGMNKEKIAIGEIGGKGYGYWDGVPMAFLLRTVLQHASTLEDVQQILVNTPRTCEYYYIFSDGKTGESLAIYATPDRLKFFMPGECYFKFPHLANAFDPAQPGPNYDAALIRYPLYEQPKDVLMISRWDNYELLKNRLLANYGNIGLEDLKDAIKQPIAHPSNLHNAIFAPETLDVWIAHAGKMNEPACDEPYEHFNLINLLEK